MLSCATRKGPCPARSWTYVFALLQVSKAWKSSVHLFKELHRPRNRKGFLFRKDQFWPVVNGPLFWQPPRSTPLPPAPRAAARMAPRRILPPATPLAPWSRLRNHHGSAQRKHVCCVQRTIRNSHPRYSGTLQKPFPTMSRHIPKCPIIT